MSGVTKNKYHPFKDADEAIQYYMSCYDASQKREWKLERSLEECLTVCMGSVRERAVKEIVAEAIGSKPEPR